MVHFLCGRVVLALLCSVIAVKSATPKHGWHVHHQGNYYFFPEDGLSWPDARAACGEQGGHLVEIGSPAEQTFLEGIMAQVPDLANSHFWIGLNDRYQEGHFVWENTGRPGFYTNWEAINPSNTHPGEHCVHIMDNTPPYYRFWNDNSCAQIFRYICEL